MECREVDIELSRYQVTQLPYINCKQAILIAIEHVVAPRLMCLLAH